MKFNVNKVDNMVIQAIALLDTLDKDINTFIMRVREWYSWHFPELVKVSSVCGRTTQRWREARSGVVHSMQHTTAVSACSH